MLDALLDHFVDFFVAGVEESACQVLADEVFEELIHAGFSKRVVSAFLMLDKHAEVAAKDKVFKSTHTKRTLPGNIRSVGVVEHCSHFLVQL